MRTPVRFGRDSAAAHHLYAKKQKGVLIEFWEFGKGQVVQPNGTS